VGKTTTNHCYKFPPDWAIETGRKSDFVSSNNRLATNPDDNRCFLPRRWQGCSRNWPQQVRPPHRVFGSWSSVPTTTDWLPSHRGVRANWPLYHERDRLASVDCREKATGYVGAYPQLGHWSSPNEGSVRRSSSSRQPTSVAVQFGWPNWLVGPTEPTS